MAASVMEGWGYLKWKRRRERIKDQRRRDVGEQWRKRRADASWKRGELQMGEKRRDEKRKGDQVWRERWRRGWTEVREGVQEMRG